MVLLMTFKVLKVLVLKCFFSPSLYWIFSHICFLGEWLLDKKLLTTRSKADYTCKLNQRLKKGYKHQNTQFKFYNLEGLGRATWSEDAFSEAPSATFLTTVFYGGFLCFCYS